MLRFLQLDFSLPLMLLLCVDTSVPDDLLVTLALEHPGNIVITETPHEMADSTANECRTVSANPHNPHVGALRPAFCTVSVNQIAKKTMLQGTGKFPVGSLIVKAKLEKRDSKRVDFYTVMMKRSRGYDENHGDWEYALIDGRTSS
ncbi:MAG: hypothetical protein AAGG44_03385 [Planctomycetota bacterium]